MFLWHYWWSTAPISIYVHHMEKSSRNFFSEYLLWQKKGILLVLEWQKDESHHFHIDRKVLICYSDNMIQTHLYIIHTLSVSVERTQSPILPHHLLSVSFLSKPAPCSFFSQVESSFQPLLFFVPCSYFTSAAVKTNIWGTAGNWLRRAGCSEMWAEG